jgi:hypothetical protein
VRATTEPQAPPKPATKAPEYVEDTELSVSKISFGSILTPIGLTLLGWGFGAYFTLLPGADLSSLFLIYGFPISLLGFALSYAQVRRLSIWVGNRATYGLSKAPKFACVRGTPSPSPCLAQRSPRAAQARDLQDH